MFNFMCYLSFYLFILSFFMFSFYYKHLMLMVISLEFITVSVSFNMFILMMDMKILSFLVMFMLIFSVCEGALILSMLVLMTRFYGNDYMNSLSLMKW
uniref:NADH dehydrogenase subunit 4L n=1 Tax=Gotra octocincta TaxID=3029099 RepID=UPI0023D85D57|nr:NADH dehydrogenase subunit 4L [Gotra octocincta]WDQ40360.1 NADH dehydrogenase subunit 4L [Gotra octocincta]